MMIRYESFVDCFPMMLIEQDGISVFTLFDNKVNQPEKNTNRELVGC